MATIHPINKNPGIIAELEAATGKMAVITKGGKVVMLKIPKFRNSKKAVKQISVEMPETIPFIALTKFAAAHGCRLEFDRITGNAKFIEVAPK